MTVTAGWAGIGAAGVESRSASAFAVRPSVCFRDNGEADHRCSPTIAAAIETAPTAAAATHRDLPERDVAGTCVTFCGLVVVVRVGPVTPCATPPLPKRSVPVLGIAGRPVLANPKTP